MKGKILLADNVPKPKKARASLPPAKGIREFKKLTTVGDYLLGVILIACAVTDAAVDLFSFMSADMFFVGGLALLGVQKLKRIIR